MWNLYENHNPPFEDLTSATRKSHFNKMAIADLSKFHKVFSCKVLVANNYHFQKRKDKELTERSWVLYDTHTNHATVDNVLSPNTDKDLNNDFDESSND